MKMSNESQGSQDLAQNRIGKHLTLSSSGNTKVAGECFLLPVLAEDVLKMMKKLLCLKRM